MEFKDRLKTLRRERGMSQKELASKLNYGSTAIANYESGRNQPSIPDLIKISQTLNVSIDFLVGVTDIELPYMDMKNYENFLVFSRVYCMLSRENAENILSFAKWKLSEQAERGFDEINNLESMLEENSEVMKIAEDDSLLREIENLTPPKRKRKRKKSTNDENTSEKE